MYMLTCSLYVNVKIHTGSYGSKLLLWQLCKLLLWQLCKQCQLRFYHVIGIKMTNIGLSELLQAVKMVKAGFLPARKTGVPVNWRRECITIVAFCWILLSPS